MLSRVQFQVYLEKVCREKQEHWVEYKNLHIFQFTNLVKQRTSVQRRSSAIKAPLISLKRKQNKTKEACTHQALLNIDSKILGAGESDNESEIRGKTL